MLIKNMVDSIDFRKLLIISAVVLNLFLFGITAWRFISQELSEKVIIKDPMVIYDNMKIEQMDRQGVYGIISEAKLKELLDMKEQVPFH